MLSTYKQNNPPTSNPQNKKKNGILTECIELSSENLSSLFCKKNTISSESVYLIDHSVLLPQTAQVKLFE